MKKIGTITFHASHNYGSMLQAFALQEYFKDKFSNICEYEIINFVPKTQKTIYKSIYDPTNNLKKRIQGLVLHKEKPAFQSKYNKFESFKENYLNLTKEFETNNELRNAHFNYDYFIAGSDQIWNFNSNMADFDWSYLLDFTDSQNKISFAPSMGPIPQSQNDEKDKYFNNCLQKFKYVSVRDEQTQIFLQQNFNVKSEVLPDPTLLLTKEDWNNKLNPPKNIINGDYIFLYHFNNQDAANLAKKIQKSTNIPIVISQAPNKREFLYNFNRKFDVGPIEFISLINNSKFIITTSLHACIFSIIYGKNFYVVNGEKDFRIKSLLNHYNLEDHIINIINFKTIINKTKSIDPSIYKLIDNEREKVHSVLLNQLEQ